MILPSHLLYFNLNQMSRVKFGVGNVEGHLKFNVSGISNPPAGIGDGL